MPSTSRVEEILNSKTNQTAYSKEPLSRIETLLLNMGDLIDDTPGQSVPTGNDFSDADVADIMSVLSTEND